MIKIFSISVLFLPFIISCSGIGHESSTTKSLNTEGYYASKKVSNQGSRLYLKFYNGVGEHEGQKRVKICGANEKPDFTSSSCKDTWFIIPSKETAIQYRETSGTLSYSVRHKLEDFEFHSN